MKVAIVAPLRGTAWLGGAHYYRGLVRALRTAPADDGMRFAVLTNAPEAFGHPLEAGVEIVHAPWLDPRSGPLRFANGALANLANRNPALARAARTLGARLVTHAPVAKDMPCPTLFWMPDFQHRHLPDYFSGYERWRRDRNVRAAARSGHILFSSQSAAADFARFFPELAGRATAHVLRFPPGDDAWRPRAPDSLLAAYDLPRDYFFLPNQFWRHKNHRLVVDALRLLPDRFVVACSGALTDSRGGAHIRDLLGALDADGLRHRFRMLGVLPREDMLALLHHATAVINPSLFEGWSTVVEEAKLAGKRLLLSDIPVHREQAPDAALYFPPADPAALATAMVHALDAHDPGADRARAEQARARHPQAVRAFAHAYRRIARAVALDTGAMA